MAPDLPGLFAAFILVVTAVAARAAMPDNWSIMQQHLQVNRKKMGIGLKNYCESWKLNVELNNLRAFDAVPAECVKDVSDYMASQYKPDIQLATEESSLYLAFEFALAGDDKDAWIFDVDDTLLSTVPYLCQHQYGGEKLNMTEFEEWKAQGDAPAIDEMLSHYQKLRFMGLKLFIITSRPERLRDSTVANLLAVGYQGWNRLIMRQEQKVCDTVEAFHSKERLKLMSEGYRIWGAMGDQWSSLLGHPSAKRVFKLPNPMYYVV